MVRKWSEIGQRFVRNWFDMNRNWLDNGKKFVRSWSENCQKWYFCAFFRSFAHLLPLCPKIIQICQKLVFLADFTQKVTSITPVGIWFYMETCGLLAARSIWKKFYFIRIANVLPKLHYKERGNPDFLHWVSRVLNKTSDRRNRCSV